MYSGNPEQAALLTSINSQLALYPGTKLLPGQFIIGAGTDLCPVARMKEDVTKHPSFIKHTFTRVEIEYCEVNNPDVTAERFAARFSAKEAVIKALGGKEPGFSHLDINVLRDEAGKPYVLLSGATLRRVQALGAASETVFISMSHIGTVAQSFCVITNCLPSNAAAC